MTVVEAASEGTSVITERQTAHLQRVRGGDGRMRRTVETARRDAQCADLYSQGWTHQRIADHMGFANSGVATKAIQRAFKAVPAESVERLRQKHDRVLNRLLTKAVEIMERSHFAHSQGRVVRACPGPGTHDGCTATNLWQSQGSIGDGCPGIPVLDDGPKLQAITVARGLLERSAKLHGLDAPVRTAIEGDELVIRIKGVDTDAV